MAISKTFPTFPPNSIKPKLDEAKNTFCHNSAVRDFFCFCSGKARAISTFWFLFFLILLIVFILEAIWHIVKKIKDKKKRTEYQKQCNVEYVKVDVVSYSKNRETAIEERIEPTDSEEIQRKRRPSIPRDIRNQVWRRDGGKCVDCGCNKNLEFDHIIPASKGGANTYRNIQLLCQKCNRKKSNKIG